MLWELKRKDKKAATVNYNLFFPTRKKSVMIDALPLTLGGGWHSLIVCSTRTFKIISFKNRTNQKIH